MKKPLIIAALTLLTFALTACDPPEGIIVSIDAPTTATLGETYDITVSTLNSGEETQLLTSIDLGTAYLDYTTLNSTTPNYTEEWEMGYLGFNSYDYYAEIQPGETMDIIFNMTANTAGTASGTLDVCINTESDCVFNTVSTLIQ
jgi:hypothetical protein